MEFLGGVGALHSVSGDWTAVRFRAIVASMDSHATSRRFPRALLHLRVAYRNFEGRTDFTRDISVGGACIRTPNPVARGTLLGLFLDVPSAEVPFEVGAEVIWCKTAGQSAGMGVQFIYASEPQRWLFERQLRQLNPS